MSLAHPGSSPEDGKDAEDVAGRQIEDVHGADGPPEGVPRVGGEEEGDHPGGRERDMGEGQPAPFRRELSCLLDDLLLPCT